MMGHRDKLKTGDEVDGICAKHLYNWGSGVRKLIKRAVNKRARKQDIPVDDTSD